MSKLVILKVGGSTLSLNEEEIFSFKNAIALRDFLEDTPKDLQFILCLGGGYLARKYQLQLKENNIGEEDQHLIGVAAINMNAVMLQIVFGLLAEDKILRYEDYDSNNEIKFEKKFMITAAGSPGHSSDWNATKLAIRSNAKRIISLKNVDGVYTADPKKNPDATRIENLTWDKYLDIIGNPQQHTPGGSYPVDPLASRLAQDNDIEFTIVDGKDLENLKNLLKGLNFKGSRIMG